MNQDTHDTRSRLIELAEPVCADAGYDLVDLRYLRDTPGWVVRVFIDRLDESNGPIGFSDCEGISRELSALFDVEDPVPTAYSLEVSSPGVERPLRTALHFRRVIGREVKISLQAGVAGRRNFKGTVTTVADDDTSVDVSVDGTPYSLPLSDLRSAKLVVNWEVLLKRDSSAREEHTGS